ncbi:MAG: hypothetical protein GWP50_04555 [Proteobacteria bacterium]|nr:hypothetical protein [Pseudomonadota bacterium]
MQVATSAALNGFLFRALSSGNADLSVATLGSDNADLYVSTLGSDNAGLHYELLAAITLVSITNSWQR